jgi:hypothetical protein
MALPDEVTATWLDAGVSEGQLRFRRVTKKMSSMPTGPRSASRKLVVLGEALFREQVRRPSG